MNNKLRESSVPEGGTDQRSVADKGIDRMLVEDIVRRATAETVFQSLHNGRPHDGIVYADWLID